jgi:hypothetical protein
MKLPIAAFCVVVLLLSFSPMFAQEVFRPLRTDAPPTIDGMLDDPVWRSAPSVNRFKTWRPDFGAEMIADTRVFAAYDAENLYFAFRCYDPEPAEIKTSVSNRDNIRSDDWIAINLDSFNDQQSLYVLYANPDGIQGDTRYAGGHEDHDFDLVWYSDGKIDEEGYVVEISLPLSSIRYADGDSVYMGVIFERSVSRRREMGTYPPLDPAQGESWLTQTMPMVFSDLLGQTLLEVLPATTYAYSQDHESGVFRTINDAPELSLTAKYGLTSELVLDGTLNPDFSQVEADAGQVDVNLRYDLFFPEKRPFFLEGRAHFGLGATGTSGTDPIQSIVHTRKIVDPITGIRLTGKMSEKDIVAAIYAADELTGFDPSGDKEYAHVPIVRYKRLLRDDSYVGGIYTARLFGDHLNVAGGADGVLRLSESSTIGYHGLLSHSREDMQTGDFGGHAVGVFFANASRNVDYGFTAKNVSEDFEAETGFITRTGLALFSGTLRPKFYPSSSLLQRIDVEFFSAQTRDAIYDMWETANHISLRHFLLNRMTLSVRYSYATEIFLAERFQTGGLLLSTSGRITNQLAVNATYRKSDAIYYSAEPYQGSSELLTVSATAQPTDNLQAVASYVRVDFRGEKNSTNDYVYRIYRGKLTYQLSRYLFFRGIVEYNDFRDDLLTDLLASFTYIPGTVFHIGYGSLFDKTRWENDRYVPSDRFSQTRRQLFIKGSYLWRM